jgi:glutaminyl-peptide cyclotransferase
MNAHLRSFIATAFALVMIFLCANAIALKPRPEAGFKASSRLAFEIKRVLPHDPLAFTEGLELCDGAMLESLGLYGSSALNLRTLDSIEVLARHALPSTVFGEGATCFGDRVYQLTWRERTVVVYDRKLQPLTVLHYDGEGWGLAHDDRRLIMSNGSSQIVFRDPEDFSIVRTISVRDGETPVDKLNELEYAHGLIFANVWQSTRIAIIDPADGRVCAWIDLDGLSDRFDKPAGWNARDDVLNGIAYDPARDSFYVTGKRWPLMFELKLGRLPTAASRAAH